MMMMMMMIVKRRGRNDVLTRLGNVEIPKSEREDRKKSRIIVQNVRGLMWSFKLNDYRYRDERVRMKEKQGECGPEEGEKLKGPEMGGEKCVMKESWRELRKKWGLGGRMTRRLN